MADNTIDTLIIKVEGEDKSATSTLDDVVSKLERIKGAANESSSSVNSLGKILDNLKRKVNSFKTNEFKKATSSAAKSYASSRAQQTTVNIKDNAPDYSGTETRTTPNDDTVAKASKFSEKLSEIKTRISEATAGAKSFGTQVKTAFSDTIVGRFGNKIKSVISALGRIALYRIMRSIIKQVTDAFATGVNNMYQYSKRFNGDFSKNMDSAASSLLTFKNSIGAVMAPIINLVVPWLDKVVDKVIEINNTIAMVIAGLTGKSTYSKAVRVTTEYAAAADVAADKTSNVKERVEELKRSLAGLDEITIIGENNNDTPLASYNSGIDKPNNAVDYGSMFVEAPVDMAKVNEIKKKLEKILQIAKWIGLAIAAWKLVKFLSDIGEAIAGLGTLGKKALGITLMIAGFAIEWMGAYDMGKNGINLKNAILTAIGAALSIAGSLLTFGTTPVGWAIGFAVAITVAATAYIKGAMDAGKELAELTEFHKKMTEISDRATESLQRSQQALSDLEEKKKSLDTTLSDFSAAQLLIDQIFNLYEKSDLSASEIEDLKTKIEVLNGLGLDGLQLEFEESSGTLYQIKTDAEGATEKIIATRDSVNELTESLKEQAIQTALTELLTEAYKKQFEALAQVEEKNKEVTTAQAGAYLATTQYTDYLKNDFIKDGIIQGAKKLGYYKEQMENSQTALENAKSAQEENNKVLESSQNYIDTVTSALTAMKTGAANYSDPATKSSDILNSSVKKGTENVGDLKASLKNFSYDSVTKSYADDASSSTEGLTADVGKAQNKVDSLKGRTTDFYNNSTVSSFADRAKQSGRELSDQLTQASKDAQALRNSLSQIDGFSGNFSYSYSFGNTPRYATGGFPENGMFFANDSELVGQFSNGKTAVANNEQIIEGIAGGVASANEEQNNLLREQNRLLRMLLDKDSSIDVSTIASAFNRKNQRDGKVTVPVSV